MKKIVLTLILLGTYFVSNSQQINPKYQSLLIYNFTKYMDWPNSTGDFIINVLGESDVLEELQKMALIKKVGDRQIKVYAIKNLSEIGNCQILFISLKMSARLNDVLLETNGKGILVIGEKPGLGELGAGINFVNRGGKLKFELNKPACVSNGINVSGKLESLSILL